jgi:hypothetical protein
MDEIIESIGYEIIDHLEDEIGALALSFFASIERINKIIELPMEKVEKEGYLNRHENKEIWGAALSYSIFLHEMSMSALAKIIEDVKVDLKRKLNIRFHPWNEDLDLPYLKHLKSCWALSNIIKHNQSMLTKGSSKYVDFILAEWDLIAGYDLEITIVGRHALFDMVEYMPKIYLALCTFVEQKTGAKGFFVKANWLDMMEDFYRYLVPEKAEINIPIVFG